MDMLTVSKAKAQFSGIARKVVRSKKAVIVRVPNGFIQIAPHELPEEISAVPAGTLKLLPREVELHNTFGESLRTTAGGISSFSGRMKRTAMAIRR